MATITLLSILADYAVRATRVDVIRRARFDKQWFSEDDVRPTLDCNGRMHAPCDNYAWDDREYMAGEYLHCDNEYSDLFGGFKSFPSSDRKTRVKINLSDFAAIKELIGNWSDLSHGKSWSDKSGNTIAYLYVTTKRKTLVDAIEGLEVEQKAAANATRNEGKGIAPEGKDTVTGVIGKITVQEGYAYNSPPVLKAYVILDNKSTVWGTLPAKISCAEVGDTVEFTATFKHAPDGNTHAFYSRPTKPSIVESRAA